jgi:CheY-like chemotaxis protein
MSTAQVLTANRLTDGIAVWYDRDGKWNEWIGKSVVASTKEEVAALEAVGKKAFADNVVLDVNLVEVEEIDGQIRPLRLRERIRAEGPTIEYMI